MEIVADFNPVLYDVVNRMSMLRFLELRESRRRVLKARACNDIDGLRFATPILQGLQTGRFLQVIMTLMMR